jgi:type VI secretion system protein ImpG
MNRRFLEHYEVELGHLRRMADEFKRDYPKAAGRLSLGMDPPDPYVERLLEGFAFLAARVQLKLDAEFPRFIQSLVETVYPHFLTPLPAMAMVRFVPDWSGSIVPEGYPIPRGTPLRGLLGRGETTPCVFTTAQEVCLLPVSIVEARYYTRDLEALDLPELSNNRKVKAALGLRLQTHGGLTFDQINLQRLILHLPGLDELPGLLYEQILARRVALLLQSARRPVERYGILPAAQVRRFGFAEEDALLPPSSRIFSGYRLLQEYFAFPKRFLFVELAGLTEAVRKCTAPELQVVVALDKVDPALEKRSVDASCFDLYCTPAINLFTKRGISVDLKRERSEYHVVPDRVRTLDYEVYQLEEVVGVSSDPQLKPRFRSFYFAPDQGEQHASFFTTYRVPRKLTDRERRFGEVSDYFGTDLYISLVDADAAPYNPDLNGLEITALCTNRHLPIQMSLGAGPSDFSLDLAGPLKSVQCLVKTDPKPSLVDGEVAWKVLSHFSLNYRSLLDLEGDQGALALQELLKIYADPADPHVLAQVRGLRSARATTVFQRLPVSDSAGGPVSFGRGLSITLRFDESPFTGTGVFLLGAVMEQFFARYVSLNSFTETAIETEQRGKIIQWPPQIGRRQIL